MTKANEDMLRAQIEEQRTLHADMLRNTQKLGEAEAQIALLRGKIEATWDTLVEDDEFCQTARARAWLKHDPKIVMYSGPKGISGVPTGWPPGVDGAVYVADYAASIKASRMERTFGKDENAHPAMLNGDLVQRFLAKFEPEEQ